MSFRRPGKRAMVVHDDKDEDVFYCFEVLLPNGTSVKLTVNNPNPQMPMGNFANLVKEEYDKAQKDYVLLSKRTRIYWSSDGKFSLESNHSFHLFTI
ncbi:Structural maintenance of chromosomes flexible hinge domain-containing protein GMI1 [Cardamine amara subsp. amara]|uniref:Structural maintenance of chromosomes flexible hinge domain-containing protein GMI1 n=1 Tax=Cardamine amara subsp. amara TaxID=228776 RepID=A0ABD1AJR5_CARAN